MRRRVPDTATVEAEMPARLQRFRLEDWADEVGPEPEHWNANTSGYPWVPFKARILFGRARNRWRAEHGLGWWGATEERRRRYLESGR